VRVGEKQAATQPTALQKRRSGKKGAYRVKKKARESISKNPYKTIIYHLECRFSAHPRRSAMLPTIAEVLPKYFEDVDDWMIESHNLTSNRNSTSDEVSRPF
jgi:hypothetical protein